MPSYQLARLCAEKDRDLAAARAEVQALQAHAEDLLERKNRSEDLCDELRAEAKALREVIAEKHPPTTQAHVDAAKWRAEAEALRARSLPPELVERLRAYFRTDWSAVEVQARDADALLRDLLAAIEPEEPEVCACPGWYYVPGGWERNSGDRTCGEPGDLCDCGKPLPPAPEAPAPGSAELAELQRAVAAYPYGEACARHPEKVSRVMDAATAYLRCALAAEVGGGRDE